MRFIKGNELKLTQADLLSFFIFKSVPFKHILAKFLDISPVPFVFWKELFLSANKPQLMDSGKELEINISVNFTKSLPFMEISMQTCSLEKRLSDWTFKRNNLRILSSN